MELDYLACYEGSLYDISTKGHEKNTASGIHGYDLLTVLDSKREDDTQKSNKVL